MTADHHVLQHRQPVEQRDVLEGAADSDHRDLMAAHGQDRLALKDDFSSARLVEPAEAIEQRGLAGTIRADQPGDLPRHNVEANVIERDHAPEAERDTSYRQKRCRLARH